MFHSPKKHVGSALKVIQSITFFKTTLKKERKKKKITNFNPENIPIGGNSYSTHSGIQFYFLVILISFQNNFQYKKEVKCTFYDHNIN